MRRIEKGVGNGPPPLIFLRKMVELIVFGFRHDSNLVKLYMVLMFGWVFYFILFAIDGGIHLFEDFIILLIIVLAPFLPLYFLERREKPEKKIPKNIDFEVDNKLVKPEKPIKGLIKDTAEKIDRVKREKYQLKNPKSDEKTRIAPKSTDPKSKEIVGKSEPEKKPLVRVELDFPEGLAYVGKEARIYVRVENKSDHGIEDIDLKARFTGALGVDKSTINLDFLAPKDVSHLYWTLKPKVEGTYTIYKPSMIFKTETGSEQKIELDSLRMEVKEAPKEKQKKSIVSKKSKKALFSPWCPECQKYKGRQAECPHCGHTET